MTDDRKDPDGFHYDTNATTKTYLVSVSVVVVVTGLRIVVSCDVVVVR